MKYTCLVAAALLGAILTSGVRAQIDAGVTGAASGDELDQLMNVVDENATPEDVIDRLNVPPAREEVEQLPDVELTESPLDSAPRASGKAAREAAGMVTENINDALSTGNPESLPDDVARAIPPEVIEELFSREPDDEMDDEDADENMAGRFQ